MMTMIEKLKFMWQSINLRYKIAIIACIAVILSCVAFLFYRLLFTPEHTEKAITTQSSKAISLDVSQNHKLTTSVAIQPKKSGDADIEVASKSNYIVEVNGKREELKPVVKETTKLENNKVVVTQENTVTTKVTLPTPAFSIGAGMNTKGETAIVADGRIYKNLNWWAYGSRTEQAGGLKVTVYK